MSERSTGAKSSEIAEDLCARLGAQLGPSDLERALTVRAGLYALLRAHSGAVLDADDAAKLDEALSASYLRLRVPADGDPHYEPAGSGLDEACARLGQILEVALREGVWRHLKICADDTCGRAFYDYSPSHTGKWCSLRCRDRNKSKAFRKRNPGADLQLRRR